MAWARCFALLSAGRSIEAKIAMIAITMRSSIRVKIRIFTLRSKNIEQGTGKEEVEKHLNNSTMERRKEKRGWTGIDCVLFGRPLPAANYDRFRYWKQNHGGGLAPRSPENHFHHDIIPNSGSYLFFALRFPRWHADCSSSWPLLSYFRFSFWDKIIVRIEIKTRGFLR